ncbi:MAG: hypothetical protein AB7V42_09045 [Thermoleophilia bacterium]
MSALDDLGSAGAGYLEHLTADDVALVARLAGLAVPDGATALVELRRAPHLVERALASDAALDLLRGPVPDDPDREPLVHASPFLAFAVAVERIRGELRDATYVQEWAGAGQRLPVLGGDDLRELLADGQRRVFLAALLASFTRVASGSVWRETPRGWRRQRFSELDPVRLAALLDTLPEARRPQVHRRLGDVSLFLAGVFPDHTAARVFRPIDLHRLGRAAAIEGGPGEALGEALETRGGVGLLDQLGERWYRLAVRGAAAPAAASTRLLEAIASRFVEARRALNLLADRHLFPVQRSWFPRP